MLRGNHESPMGDADRFEQAVIRFKKKKISFLHKYTLINNLLLDQIMLYLRFRTFFLPLKHLPNCFLK